MSCQPLTLYDSRKYLEPFSNNYTFDSSQPLAVNVHLVDLEDLDNSGPLNFSLEFPTKFDIRFGYTHIRQIFQGKDANDVNKTNQ